MVGRRKTSISPFPIKYISELLNGCTPLGLLWMGDFSSWYHLDAADCPGSIWWAPPLPIFWELVMGPLSFCWDSINLTHAVFCRILAVSHLQTSFWEEAHIFIFIFILHSLSFPKTLFSLQSLFLSYISVIFYFLSFSTLTYNIPMCIYIFVYYT